ncbi:hypothetical protein KZ418_10530, partial [Glaesserella parasuis]|nr:hypothetical protein [Glaesserella parasuis]MCT8593066.1 hypothetical protein [Glaesserella parasuis]
LNNLRDENGSFILIYQNLYPPYWQQTFLQVSYWCPTNCRGANAISILSEWKTMKKEERRIRRNQLSVILIGWYRYRKERYCHSGGYGVLLLGWVYSVFLLFPSLNTLLHQK